MASTQKKSAKKSAPPAKGSQGSESRKRPHSPSKSPQPGRAAPGPNQESTETLEPASNDADRFEDPMMIQRRIDRWQASLEIAQTNLADSRTENQRLQYSQAIEQYKNDIAADNEALQSVLQDPKLDYHDTKVPSDPEEQLELIARSMVVYLSYPLERVKNELEKGNLESAYAFAARQVNNKPFYNTRARFIRETCPPEHKRSSKLKDLLLELEFTMSKFVVIKNRKSLDISAALDVVNESMEDRLVQAGADQYTDLRVPYNMQNPINLSDEILKEKDEFRKAYLEDLLKWTLEQLGLKPAVMPSNANDKLILEAKWMRELHSARLAHLKDRIENGRKANHSSKEESNIRKHAKYLHDKLAIWKGNFRRSKLTKGSQEVKKDLEKILSEIDSLQKSFKDISNSKDETIENLNKKGKKRA